MLGADPRGERDARDHNRWFYPSGAVLPTGEAVQNRDSRILRLLLEAGADPDAEPFPPKDENLLSLAVGLGNEECVGLLLEAGAKTRTPSGKSILDTARSKGFSNIVSRLTRVVGGE
jgi:ankyrin repeat protein